MSVSSEEGFIRYLTAKKAVDDRALNGHVLKRLEAALRGFGPGPEVLEVGAGTGTMLERLACWGLLDNARYEGIDVSPGLIAEAYRRIPLWARDGGFAVAVGPPSEIRLERGGSSIRARFEAADLQEFIDRERGRRRWDLLVAHAFLDLFDLSRVLPGLIALTRPGGLLSLTMNFDGVTILEPLVDPTLDREILALYHESMDRRVVGGLFSGDSRTGRHLLTRLRDMGVEILAAGSSDWIVHPQGKGYPGDEAFFLHYLIDLFAASLTGHPALDPDRFARWIGLRHGQIERAEMVFIAHQIDLLGRVEGESGKCLSMDRLDAIVPPPLDPLPRGEGNCKG